MSELPEEAFREALAGPPKVGGAVADLSEQQVGAMHADLAEQSEG